MLRLGPRLQMMWCQFPWNWQRFLSKDGHRMGRPPLPARTPIASPDPHRRYEPPSIHWRSGFLTFWSYIFDLTLNMSANGPNDRLLEWWGHFQGKSLFISKRSCHIVNRSRSPMRKWILGLLNLHFWLWWWTCLLNNLPSDLMNDC